MTAGSGALCILCNNTQNMFYNTSYLERDSQILAFHKFSVEILKPTYKMN